MAKNKTMIIDPPEGWRYGFPKLWDSDVDDNLREFLLHNGYPEKDVDFALKYIRMWPKNLSN
jgi:hypothetical protein